MRSCCSFPGCGPHESMVSAMKCRHCYTSHVVVILIGAKKEGSRHQKFIQTGTALLDLHEPTVVGKYVYDYNPECFPPNVCEQKQYPGQFTIDLEIKAEEEGKPKVQPLSP